MAYIGNEPAELAIDLDNGVVTTAKLANDAITAAKIVDGTIVANDLATGIITNAKVASNAAIAATKLAVSGGSNITLQSDGTFDLDNTVDVTGGYSVGGNAVIDSSRNITAGDITATGALSFSGSNAIIKSTVSNADLVFQGNSSGLFTALTLDMGNAGEATFNDDINLGNGKRLRMGAGGNFEIFSDGSNNFIKGASSDEDLIFQGVGGGSPITALRLDMSQAGEADFNGAVKVGGAIVAHQTSRGVLEYASNIFKIRSYGATAGSGAFTVQTGGGGGSTDTVALTIDSSQNATFAGSVGIGAAPDKIFHIKTAAINTAFARIESTASNSYPTLSLKNDAREYQLTAHGGVNDSFVIYDGTVGANRLVIDTNGNVIVGGNSAGLDGAVSLSNTGYIQARINNDTVAYFDRTGSGAHGEIVRLQQNGATVGSVRTYSSTVQVGQGNVNLQFSNANDHIIPSNENGTGNDDAVDLGDPNARFKHLYLSNAVYASDIIANGSGGLSLQTDEGTKRLFVKDNGDVKVGEGAVASATSAPLHVAKFNTDVQAIFGDNNSTIDNPAIRIFGRNTANSTGRFMDVALDADDNFGQIGYNPGSGATKFGFRILPSGNYLQIANGVTCFKFAKYFAAPSGTTNMAINLINEIGASTAGTLHYTVSISGYASAGANAVNAQYSVAGYSGHNYSTFNYNSAGAGTINCGYNSSGSSTVTGVGHSYHPAVWLGGYIATGSVFVYVPGGQTYGFTLANGSATTMGCYVTVEGYYS